MFKVSLCSSRAQKLGCNKMQRNSLKNNSLIFFLLFFQTDCYFDFFRVFFEGGGSLFSCVCYMPVLLCIPSFPSPCILDHLPDALFGVSFDFTQYCHTLNPYSTLLFDQIYGLDHICSIMSSVSSLVSYV